MSLYIRNDYRTLNEWLADAHSTISRIQHEVDGVELGGGDSEYIRTEALGELVRMTEAFGKLLDMR